MLAKRAFDVVLALVLLVLLSPLLLIIAVLVWLFLGLPILFVQTRAGLRGVPFRLLKFRTMSEKMLSKRQPAPDAERLTAFGRFLRASSLDELPQLLNVLGGSMSLVGPRPLLVDYLPFYSSEQARRHSILPGMTGWAQVNGRNALTWDERFALDVWYVDNRTFWLDLRIIALTVRRLVRADAGPQAAMTRFDDLKGRTRRQATPSDAK